MATCDLAIRWHEQEQGAMSFCPVRYILIICINIERIAQEAARAVFPSFMGEHCSSLMYRLLYNAVIRLAFSL